MLAQTGITIRVISQDEEALLDFVGAAGKTGYDPKEIVVWDIGVGSMQMAAMVQEGKLDVYKGQLASVSFKNYVMDSETDRRKGFLRSGGA